MVLIYIALRIVVVVTVAVAERPDNDDTRSGRLDVEPQKKDELNQNNSRSNPGQHVALGSWTFAPIALLESAPRSSFANLTLPQLLLAIGSSNVSLSLEAVGSALPEALHHNGSTALPLLRRAMDDKRRKVKESAIQHALPVAIEHTEEAWPLLERALSGQARYLAVRVLKDAVSINGTAALRLLRGVLGSSASGIRAAAASQVLTEFFQTASDVHGQPKLSKEAWPLLEQGLRDSSSNVKEACLTALSEALHTNSSGALFLLAHTLTHDTEKVKKDALRKVLARALRSYLLDALPLVDAALQDESDAVREYAAKHILPKAFQAFGKDAWPLLTRVQSDSSPLVSRWAAGWALENAFEVDAAASIPLFHMFFRGDVLARDLVVDTFRQLNILHAKEAAVPLLQDAMNCRNRTVRRLAADHLLKLPYQTHGALALMMAAAEDTDVRVRAQGLSLLARVQKQARQKYLSSMQEQMFYQVSQLVAFNESHVCAPPGIMLLLESNGTLQAHRCPNSFTCPGKRCILWELLAASRPRVRCDTSSDGRCPPWVPDCIGGYCEAQTFAYLGRGYCRPGNCNVYNQSCRTQSLGTSGINATQCFSACQHDPHCIGYAFDPKSHPWNYALNHRKDRRECYVYTNATSATFSKVATTWQAFPAEFQSIGQTSGHSTSGLGKASCYKKKLMGIDFQSTFTTQCAEGYNVTSAGCNSCAHHFGRTTTDPFQCKRCIGAVWIAWLQYIIPPTIMYGVAVHGANQDKNQFSHILKLCIAFGTSASMIENVLLFSPVVEILPKRLPAGWSSYLSVWLQFSSEVAGYVSGGTARSVDCLFADTDIGRLPRWLLPLAVPLLLLGVALLYTFTQNAISQHNDGIRSLFRVALVAVNLFLPGAFGTLLETWPCVHTQQNSENYLAWHLNRTCTERSIAALVGCTVLCMFIGPCCWAILISRRDELPDEALSFLTAGYKPHRQYWETLVLLRRMLIRAIATMFPLSQATESQIVFSSVVMNSSLLAHAVFQPFEDDLLNRVELVLLATSAFTMSISAHVSDSEWHKSLDDQFNVFLFCVFCLACTSCWLLALVVRMRVRETYKIQRASSGDAEQQEP
eukprot:TRINITY_DN23532_c0_g1_i1.p1 TRINITY_DN23532_c0_g1~~TRINITY_DN23532_c0_g1_i1.p1  ORF type:complete len:1097 (+),score=145.69 TRINITY_DN23532_c0_g1_i1:127-3417(+)